MKPNRTSVLLRSLLKDLDGSDHKVDTRGFLIKDPVMPNPSDYTDHAIFARAYQAYNIARKREMAKPTAVQMKAGLAKWVESEHRCSVVNDKHWWVRPEDESKRALFDTLLQRVRVIISDILCDRWPVLDFDPTGGATALVQRKFSFAPSKVDGTPLTEKRFPHKCAPASREYLEMMMRNNPGVARRYIAATLEWERKYDGELSYEIDETDLQNTLDILCRNVSPARLSHVPKNSKEVRLICPSHTFSIMVQKTFGDCIRKALFDVGIDLNDQSINQEWAEIGSHTGLVATVDLSAASDSISLSILHLFPKRWQSYFLSCRDKFVSAGGKSKHRLSMIAGMGNGYIFELESLVFYAMTKAVVEELKLDTTWISVYGDDIICPAPAVELLEEFFLSKGFLINREKSYSRGPFRESCGKHFFNGHDVTPWYVRSNLDDLSEIYHHYNGLSEWSRRTGNPMVSSLTQVFNCLRKNERTIVPASWSTKSGIHESNARVGCLYPTERYDKNLQRFVVTWSVLLSSPKFDVTERLPEITQVVGSLLSLETGELVVPPALWLRVRALPQYSFGWHKFRSGICPTEFTRSKFTWDVKQSRKKHRV